MDIHHLRVFTSVFKNRSFSKASEELYLSQPTISDHIKSLEEELECRLFDRLGRHIIPTKEAELLFIHASEIVEKTENIKNLMYELRNNISGEILIGASTIPGTYVLPKFMANFKEKYPLIKYQVLISDSKAVIDKILNHELLIGLVGSKIYNDKIHYRPFMEDELVICAKPNFIEKEELTIDELMSYPMILREEGSGTRMEFLKIIEKKGFTFDNLNISGCFGSTDSIKQAVMNGLGISIISKLAIKNELKFNLVKKIFLKDAEMKRLFYVAFHRLRTLPIRYRLFIEELVNKRPW
ncbi:MAG: selenium metabolism-associated LysR family transcriptional regulator [Thermodesulfovibrionales bacterium]|nr:selenium metabolism-associated LysR family transcriptional regulator [Thermodesulfovibrionales bacterium]